MKNTSEKILTAVVVLLGLVLVGLVAMMLMFHMVDFKLYPRNQEVLDLRGQEISVSHYEKLTQVMPDCEILWDVPFQGHVLPYDTKEVTVTALTEEDVLALSHMTQLEAVHAEGCRDYGLLLALQERLPQAVVSYTVPLGGQEYPRDTETLETDGASPEELQNLPYITGLKHIIVRGGDAQTDFSPLRDYCGAMGISFSVALGETVVPADADAVTAVGIQDKDIYLLDYLPNLTTLHLVQPQAAPEKVLGLKSAYPHVATTWEVDFCGNTILNTEVPDELNLAGVEITSLEELERTLAYLDGVKTVFLGQPKVDNEQIAAYRHRVRDQYKVVWEVRFGESKPFRTDSTYFFPARDGYAFNDSVSYNIRYCEDLICIDVGHLGVSDVSWLAYLPNLEYLILAHTGVQYINGIENCKKLKFLELDWSGIRDLTPLIGCTALEDLNIGKTWPDVTPLMQMPWLKNIYMIFGSSADAWRLTQALPNTKVVVSGNATVGGNWRKLPNYYAMRDCMGAYYMNG